MNCAASAVPLLFDINPIRPNKQQHSMTSKFDDENYFNKRIAEVRSENVFPAETIKMNYRNLPKNHSGELGAERLPSRASRPLRDLIIFDSLGIFAGEHQHRYVSIIQR